jgi:ATP-dependent Clp protease ATP-binding subunit ClpC
MEYHFTEKGREVMSLSIEVAESLSQSTGPSHVLLALRRQSEGIPSFVLNSFGIGDEIMLKRLVAIKTSPHSVEGLDEVTKTAMSEATKLGHRYIGPEHLFLALLRGRFDDVRDILQSYGVEPNVLADEVFMILGRDAT